MSDNRFWLDCSAEYLKEKMGLPEDVFIQGVEFHEINRGIVRLFLVTASDEYGTTLECQGAIEFRLDRKEGKENE